MWIVFALVASLFWGLSYVFSEQIYKKISVTSSLAIMSLVVAIVMFLTSYFSRTLKPDLIAIGSSKKLMLYVLGGIVALLVAELCIGFSIAHKNATLAGLIEISYPIFIALFSYILFKEENTWPTIVGGLVVFIGIFIIYFFNR